MQLVQSFISIAETAAKQQTRELNATSNETQQTSKQLMLNGKFNRLI